MANEKNTVENTEDNLIDVLSDFNTGSESVASTEETTEQAQERQEAISYLIDNKFQDTPEGRTQLATAYKELQSKTDKEKAAFNQKFQHYDRLDKLDHYLKDHPESVKLLQTKINEEKEQLAGPPPKPDGYDILDEAIDNSESAQWRDQYNAWLIDQGRVAAAKEVQTFKDDLAHREMARQDDQELTNLGLDDGQKLQFRKFLSDPGNLNNKTLVDVWRFLHGDGAVIPSGGNTADRKNLQTSAAAVSGKAPSAITPQSTELNEFWDGIMNTTNRVGGTSPTK